MRRPHVLAVDDDAAQRSAYRRILRRSRYQVSCAPCGRDGLRMAMDLCPDLILLDVSMPVMSGHEFLRRMKQLEQRRKPGLEDQRGVFSAPPVILVSARSRVHEQIDGLDAGASDYITKPFNADDLRARIRRLLREQYRHAALKLCMG